MIYRRYIGTKRLALVLVVLLLLTACQPLLRLPTAIETEPELPPLAQPDAGAGTEEPVYLAEPDAIGNIAGDYLTFTIESIPKLNSSPSGGGWVGVQPSPNPSRERAGSFGPASMGRSITGPTDMDIWTNNTGLRNVYQIIAMDAADPNANIWDFDEATDTTNSGYISLKIQIRRGHTYHILILGGYQGPASVGASAGVQDKVLLVAGYSKTMISESASEVSVSMYSMVPDIKFYGINQASPTDKQTKQPLVGPATQLSAAYSWQVDFSLSGYYGDPLRPLKTAELVADNWADGSTVTLNAGSVNYWSTKTSTKITVPIENSTNGNSFSMYLSRTGGNSNYFMAGEKGYVYFDLCISPFGYGPEFFGADAGGNDKYADKASFIKNLSAVPEWHIRNGLNFKPQDSNTWFGALSGEHEGGNRNGAVPLSIIDPTHGGQRGGVYKLNVLSEDDASGHSQLTDTTLLVGWAYNTETREFYAFSAAESWGASTAEPKTIDDVLPKAMAWCQTNGSKGFDVSGKKYFTIALDARIVNGTKAFNTGGGSVNIDNPDYKMPEAVDFNSGININLIAINAEDDVAAFTLASTVAAGTSIITVGGSTGAAALTLGDGIVLEGNVAIKKNGTLLMNSGTGHDCKISGSENGGLSLGGASGAPAVFTLRSGSVTGNKGGGIIINEYGQASMAGGSITDNYTTGSGGGVNIASTSGAEFYMTGGTISGNTANISGGGIITGSTGNCYMTGGLIAGDNTVGSGGSGHGASFTGGRITFTSPDGTSIIKTGVIGTGDQAVYFPDDGGSDHFYEGNAELQITVEDSVQAGQAGIYLGWWDDLATFQQKLPEVSWVWHNGQYQYFGDYTIAGISSLEDGYDSTSNVLPNAFALCKAIKAQRPSIIPGEGLTIVLNTDPPIDGNLIQIDGTYPSINMTGWKPNNDDVVISLNNNGTIIEVKEGGDFKLRSGINLTGLDEGNDSPVVKVTGGEFYLLSGGSIRQNYCGSSANGGGGVLVYSDTGPGGSFIMDGGIISGCHVIGSNGGGLCVKGFGQAVLTSGTIHGCTVTNGMGGAVYVEQTNKTPALSLNGVNIAGNQADKGGGLALANGASVQFSAGTIGASNESSKDSDKNTASLGGGVYIKGTGSFSISNTAAISYNTATTDGGGIYLDAASTWAFAGGKVQNNTANGTSSNGGGVYVSTGSSGISFSGMSVTANTANGNGGGVYTAGAVDLSASNINGNNAGTNGGGLYADTGSTVTLSGAAVQNNAATGKGGGVYMNGGTLTHTHGTVSGNKAASGGGAYVGAGTYTMQYPADNTNNIALITGSTQALEAGSAPLNTTTSDTTSAALYGTLSFSSESYGVIGGDENLLAGGSQGTTNYSITVKNTAAPLNPADYYLFYDGGHNINSSTDSSYLTLARSMLRVGSLSEAVTKATALFASKGNEIVIGVPAGGSSANDQITVDGKAISMPHADMSESGGARVSLSSSNYKLTIMPMGDGKGSAVTSGNPAVIQLSGDSGSLIAVDSKNAGTLTLKGYLVLRGPATSSGLTNNIGPLVSVAGSGKVNIDSGVRIMGNNNNSSDVYGGAVSMSSGTFSMNSGTAITGNTAKAGGGGVYIAGGTFSMTSGTISGNTVTAGNGGGLFLGKNAVVTLSGGTISDCKATITGGMGGGLYVESTATTINGTQIMTCQADMGGGLAINSGAKVTFSAGTIGGASSLSDGNTATSKGGGVYIYGTGSLTGLTASSLITYNKAVNGSSGDGGGVYLDGVGTMSFDAGKVNNNTAGANGGGMYINGASGSVISITGTSTKPSISGNIATNGNGGGLYLAAGAVKHTKGIIDSNHAANGSGGGVYLAGGKYTMGYVDKTDFPYIAGKTGTAEDTSPSHNTAKSHEAFYGSITFAASTWGVIGGAKQGSAATTVTISDNSSVTVSDHSTPIEPTTFYLFWDGYSSATDPTSLKPDDAKWSTTGALKTAITTAISFFGSSGVGNDIVLGVPATKGTGADFTETACTVKMTNPSHELSIMPMTDSTDSTKDKTAVIKLSGTGSLLTLMAGKLTLKGAITLEGVSANTKALVTVTGGTFTMDSGAKITGNTVAITAAGKTINGVGVSMSGSSTKFIMNGATISNNTANFTGNPTNETANGGGVYMAGGTFTMDNSATISGNTISFNGTGSSIHKDNSGKGGGVYMASGTFTMSNKATITGNTMSYGSNFSGAVSGGGVYIASGTFTMESAAKITSNKATSGGSGVCIAGGSFTMSSSDTEIASNGEGVLGSGGGIFIAGGTVNSGGLIHNNHGGNGGGVYVGVRQTLTVTGGVIYGNSAGNGGGIYLDQFSTWNMNGGTVVGGSAWGTYAANSSTYNTSYDPYHHHTFRMDEYANVNINGYNLDPPEQYQDTTIPNGLQNY